jgi:ABC transporter substrate binding protein
VSQLNNEVAPKRLELLHEVVPKATVMGYLVNPADPNVETTDVQAAARKFGVELHVLKASVERDFDEVFARLVQLRAGGLVIGASSFFLARQEQLAALAVRHAVPAIFENRQFAVAGGLMSYGSSLTDAYRLTGVYTARILKGEKPSDCQSSRPLSMQAVAQDSSRFAPLQGDQLSTEQKKWADSITAPPRNGNFNNPPYRAYIRSPELAARLTPLSDYLRWNTSLICNSHHRASVDRAIRVVRALSLGHQRRS